MDKIDLRDGNGRHRADDPVLPTHDRTATGLPTGYDRLRPTVEPPTRHSAVEEVRLARIALRLGLLSQSHLDIVLERAGRALAGDGGA